MTIQWYPGHMTKARRELELAMPKQDVIIEVLDARMPSASENPVIAELRGSKPCIKVLSKSDLADPAVTTAWMRYFDGYRDGRGMIRAIASTTDRPSEIRARIPELCRELGIAKTGRGKFVRALIAGIPNVGKSTLINILMNRVVAKVSDKPAVTKAQQQVTLPSGMILWDSPGILWPKQDDEAASYRLALGGAIPNTAIDYENVAMFGAQILLEHYPAPLLARYQLEEKPKTPEALLVEIGRRRGCLRSGAVVDLHKASEIFVHECRAGLLGRWSLERP